MSSVFVGTSGWSYNHWRNGVFYPPKLPNSNWLAYYAERFNTVEQNGSFYRVPNSKSVRLWAETAPPGFVFVIKVWRTVTHYNRLLEFEKNAETFLEAIAPIGDCLGPLLVQLPPMLHLDTNRLDSFLETFRRQIRRRFPTLDAIRVAVEFRHSSWYVPEVMDILSGHEAAAVVHDMPGSKLHSPNDAPFVYVRRHGAKGRYSGSYPSDKIEEDACRIQSWQQAGKDVYVYYNNDHKGYAIQNALELKKQLHAVSPT